MFRYEAVELCGRLPLLLSIAGGMLEQHGGECDLPFVQVRQKERERERDRERERERERESIVCVSV